VFILKKEKTSDLVSLLEYKAKGLFNKGNLFKIREKLFMLDGVRGIVDSSLEKRVIINKSLIKKK
jgi:hypothetical protein